MKILFLCRYSCLGASSRLRAIQYIGSIEHHFISCRVQNLFCDSYLEKIYSNKRTPYLLIFKAYAKRLFNLCFVMKYDLIFLEKEVFPGLPAFVERLWKYFSIRYVVDYDDAIFINYRKTKKHWHQKILRHKIDYIMRNAECVIAGNQYLYEYALKAGAKKTLILPTVVDINRYPVKCLHEFTPDFFIVGWIGTSKTVRYLNEIIPILEKNTHAPIKLNIIGVSIDDVIPTCLSVECIPWSEDTEAQEIVKFDVGIMPLPDDDWSRGKCGYKLIQYMASGIPVIGSPVGVNAEIIDHKINGFLVSNIHEWNEYINTIYNSPALAMRMGASGRKRVSEQYSLETNMPKLIECLISNC